ncbi:glutamine-hydrolyzing asparagine synthase [Meredithblackwellia eburnea MCA 4105]
MCGIFAVHHYGKEKETADFRRRAVDLSKRLRHRGPDWSGCCLTDDSILCHERLAIVGVDTGAQPLISDDGKLILAVNGEIYNHRTLRKNLKTPGVFKTHSDCEVILHLYKEHGTKLCGLLDGMFSFVLLDNSVSPSRMIAARDPIGITTLYMGRSSTRPGTVYFASELKALHDECDDIISFPPGHVYDSSTDKLERYYNPTWWPEEKIPTAPADLARVRETLEKAVKKRLMSEVPYGVLLSGGLDSSLIAAIAARETDKVAQAQSQARDASRGRSASLTSAGGKPEGLVGVTDDEVDTLTAWPRLHSFSIGLADSPDLIAARVAAEFLGTAHHEYTFTVQEGLDAVREVIYHLETYDVTTVRASTPMYLLSRKIKAMGVKMVLSGEGSDEIFGGYLYFHAAPTAKDFHQECNKRVKNLHTSDCLRANKSTMAWGLEARVPFLDKEFLEVSLNIRPEDKMFGKGSKEQKDKDGRPIMEKYILRKAFDVDEKSGERPYLPDSILWRQKEQFSDGVGYSWIDGLKEFAEKEVTDAELASAASRWPVDTPETKEAYYIRKEFEGHFPTDAAARTAVRWIPRADWGCAADPSGRAVAIHDSAYEKKAEA